MKDLSQPPRHRADRHHPQPRRRGPLRRPRQRDVCGAYHRAGHGRRHLSAALPSLHYRPHALGAAARHAARATARDHRGAAAGSARAARRLPLRAALFVSRRNLRPGSGAARDRHPAPFRLLARRGDRGRHARGAAASQARGIRSWRRTGGGRWDRAAARRRGPAQVLLHQGRRPALIEDRDGQSRR